MSAQRFCAFPAPETALALIAGWRRQRSIEALTLVAALSGAASCALAEPFSISASVDSKAVVRGIDYSLGRPAYSLNLSYDAPGGVYAGVTATGTASTLGFRVMRGALENVGYARKISSDLTLDGGVSHADYLLNTHEKYILAYNEVYAGATYHNLSAYLYYTPRYMGEGPESLYLDVRGAVRASPNLRLSGHVGFLAPLSKWRADADRRKDVDLSASAIYEMPHSELRLTWSTSSHYFYDLPRVRTQSDSLSAGVVWFF